MKNPLLCLLRFDFIADCEELFEDFTRGDAGGRVEVELDAAFVGASIVVSGGVVPTSLVPDHSVQYRWSQATRRNA